MTCPECGTYIEEDEEECPHCGLLINNLEHQNRKKRDLDDILDDHTSLDDDDLEKDDIIEADDLDDAS